MDIASLAKDIAAFLAPCLPYLLIASEKASEEAGKKLGSDLWEKSKNIWAKLGPKVESKPAALEAVQDVAKCPTDEDALSSLRHQIKKILANDGDLVKDLTAMREMSSITTQIYASGENNIVTGQINLNGDGIIIGNHDSVFINKTK